MKLYDSKISSTSVRFPFRPRLRLTLYCNLRCSYCFARDFLATEHRSQEMTISEVETILASCSQEGIPLVGWQGGEPLLHSRIEEIAALHRKYGIAAIVFTNGVVPQEKLVFLKGVAASVLINYNPPDIYTTSEAELLERNVSFMTSILGRDRVVLGINVTNPTMNTNFFSDAIGRFGLNEARVDLTRPAPSMENIHISFADNKKMFQKLRRTVKETYLAGAKMVHFDCPFPLCQLSPSDRDFAWEFFHDGVKYGRCRSGLDISPGLLISSCFCSLPFKEVKFEDFDGFWDAWMFIRSVEDKLRWERVSCADCEDCPYHASHVCQGGCLGYKLKPADIVDSRFVARYRQTDHARRNAHLAKAYRLFFTGQHDESLEMLQTLDSPDPEGEVRFLHALNYVCKGYLEEAERLFCESIQQSPFPAVAGFEAGAALRAAGDGRGAIRVMEMALGLNHPARRECYRLHNGLAALYRAVGEVEIARQHFRRACELAPVGWKDAIFSKGNQRRPVRGK